MCQFYYVNNMTSCGVMSQPKQLDSDSLLEKFEITKKLNFEFIIYKASPVILLATDYDEGVH